MVAPSGPDTAELPAVKDGGDPGRPGWRRRAGSGAKGLARNRYVRIGAAAIVVGVMMGYGVRAAGPTLHAIGPPGDAHLSEVAVEDTVFRVQVDPASALDGAELRLDGMDVTGDARVVAGEIAYRPPELAEGTHSLELSVDRPFVPWPATKSWDFTIDRTRPTVTFDADSARGRRGQPIRVQGEVSEPATLIVGGQQVDTAGTSFALPFDEPPNETVVVSAIDRAGNVRGFEVPIAVEVRRPPEPVRSVHMSAASWAVPGLREPVLQLIDDGLITAVQLDLKDERGEVGYDSRVPLAKQIGAITGHYQLEEAVEEIHSRGARVIGRVVAFRDPALARHALANGRPERVIQTPGGAQFAPSEGFVNFADPAVRKYNIAIAKEASARGVDEILYDYVRRPDGPLETMEFPGLRGGAQASVASFLGETREALEPHGAFLGASLFGVAATRPEEIAQNVDRIARNVDYVAPLVYPSGWARGEYDVPDPEGQPGAIVERSVRDFVEQAEGSGARVVPWLQDYSTAVRFDAGKIRAQIEGARRAGVDEWIFWDPEVTYTAGGFTG